MNMEKIKKNVVVGFTYDLKDDEGNLLDRSDEGPLEYIHGHRNIVAGLENKLEGKTIGDRLLVIVSPEEGYGEFDESLIVDAARAEFADMEDLEEGMLVQAATEQGEQVLRVVEITEEIVKLDGNHPLAGMTLHFDVEIVSIRPPTKQELDHGHVHHDGHDHH
jgi:FKBP-type peptidyl-prolyl cis-trans isomerase SlyD